jgi:hypothetical protein
MHGWAMSGKQYRRHMHKDCLNRYILLLCSGLNPLVSLVISNQLRNL